MINAIFITGMALAFAGLFYWGFKTLPAERWQMIASVPVKKTENGSWLGLNFTYYGFFSATASIFGICIAMLLMASIRIQLTVTLAIVAVFLPLCVAASRMIAAVVERKKNTFTIAGAAFVGSLLLPPVLWLAQRALQGTDYRFQVMPALAVIAIAYALSEAIGRLACLSFGCCYGMPLRDASPALARLFSKHPAIFHGETKKAAYASRLQDEPLIPVQALTSVIYASSGLAGLSFFLAQRWRWAMIVPVVGAWGWRALAELLRADYRGSSRISVYQIMSVVSLVYLCGVALLLPSAGPRPDLAAAFSQFQSSIVILGLQAVWVALFAYYGRSSVTSSVVSFHVTAP